MQSLLTKLAKPRFYNAAIMIAASSNSNHLNRCTRSSITNKIQVGRALRIGIGIAALVWMLSPYAASAQQYTCSSGALKLDYQALVAFYNSTGGGKTWNIGWYKTWNSTWWPLYTQFITRPNINYFDGAEASPSGDTSCPDSDGCVKKLLFAKADRTWRTTNERLSGTLPPEMGDFCALHELVLAENNITGPIPAEIANNKKLFKLDLSENQLSGPIPPGVLAASSVQQLFLDDNQLTGPLPSTLGGALFKLRVDKNKLTGRIPESITKNTAFTELYWGHNNGLCMPDNATVRNWIQNDLTTARGNGPMCVQWQGSFSEPMTLTWAANQYAAYTFPEATADSVRFSFGGRSGRTVRYESVDMEYSLSAALPAGLVFDPRTRSISGASTAKYSQRLPLTYFAKAKSQVDGLEVWIKVSVPLNLEDVHAKTLTKGEAIGPEGELPAATGGWPEYTYDLSPKDALPAGVSFTTARSADGGSMTGRLQGTPAEAMEPTPFRYTATDREGTSLTKEFVLTVRSAFQLQRPAGQIDTVFVEARTIEDSLRLPEAINGSGDYLYFTDDDLPAGLVQSLSGRQIGGTPSVPSDRAEYTYVAYDNASGDEDSMPYWLTVASKLVFPDTPLDDSLLTFEVGTPIRPLEFADASGGLEREYAFGPDLPPGLSFDAGTPDDGKSTIKGTPTEPWGPVWYTYRVEDVRSSQVDSLHFGIEVVEAFALARPTDRYYTVGVPVSDVVAGARGGTSHSYAVDKGLPPGLTLDAPAGRIHGTPTGIFPRTKFAWTVTDSILGTKRQDLFIAVDPRLALPDARRYTFVLDERRAETLPKPTGGRPGYTYAVEGLPDWLGFDATTRVLEGEPSVAMDWKRYDYMVTDSVGRRDTMALHIRAVEGLRLSRRVEDQEYMVGVPSSYQFPLCRNCEAGSDISYALLTPTSPLPEGLTYYEGTRTLSGTPTSAMQKSRYTYAVEDRDTDREIGEDFTMVVYDALQLVSRVDTLAYVVGEEIEAYGFPHATGGRGEDSSYVYSVGSRSDLPDLSALGFDFDPATRALSGTPTTPLVLETFVYTVRDLYQEAWTDSTIFVIDVAKAPLTLPKEEDRAYTVDAPIPDDERLQAASGGRTPEYPYVYSLHPLPDGLVFDSNSLALSGRPEAIWDGAVTYAVTDAAGRRDTASFRIRVWGQLSFSDPIPDQVYTVGEAIAPWILPPVDQQDDSDSFQYDLADIPDLPAGLQYDKPTRRLSGTPVQVQTRTKYTYSVRDTEVHGRYGEETLHITVGASAALIRDRDALIALYESTDGENWDSERNEESGRWLIPPATEVAFTAEDLDAWYGVSIDSIDAMGMGRVSTVELPGNNLRGFLPDELGNLEKLRQLRLYDNTLTSEVPASLGQLADLEKLLLHETGLSGRIPPSLGNLKRLTHLHLHKNNLEGPLPDALGMLPEARQIWLYGNGLSGSIPPELGRLANLRSLLLNNNALSRDIPKELGQLAFLSDLWLHGNALTGSIPPELGRLDSLQTLLLHDNKLTGAIPPALGQLLQLRTLWLNDNELAGSIPSALGNAMGLRELWLSGNALQGMIPSSLGRLDSLRGLRLHDNALTGAIPSSLGQLDSLEWLQLSGNALTGSVPDSLGHLVRLTHLYLHDNKLTGLLPTSLMQLRALRELFFDGQALCAPPDEAVQDWLASLRAVRGDVCGEASLTFSTPVPDQHYTVAENVAGLVLPQAAGGAEPYRYTLYPDLPVGLKYDPSARTLYGVPTDTMTAKAFRYVAVDDTGNRGELTFTITVESGISQLVELYGNYPNPFRGSTRMELSLAKDARVSVEVFDLLGRRVMVQPPRLINAGARRSLTLAGLSDTPGVYLYRVVIVMGRQTLVRTGRMTVVR